MHVYSVKMDVLRRTLGKRGKSWQSEEEIWVLANGDAQKAVKKAHRHWMGHRINWEDDRGLPLVDVPLKTRLVSVTCEGTIDVR